MLSRRILWFALGCIFLAGLFARTFAPFDYRQMSREEPNAAPSRTHLLGTDEAGRDRFSRILVGTQISLALAFAAALLSVVLAAVFGGIAGFFPGFADRAFWFLSDLFLCLPWMFLLIAVRAVLPLNTSPEVSVLLTFLLLGALAWAGPARIARVKIRRLLQRDDRVMALAAGIPPLRAFFVYLLPNLLPILSAQFWIALPVFILSEADVSMIGLGVAEPLPSWGTLLKSLDNFRTVYDAPWLLAPLVLLIAVVALLQIALSTQGSNFHET